MHRQPLTFYIMGEIPRQSLQGAKCPAFITSSIASPICQEGQSERTFPIFAFSCNCSFFPIFPDFPLFFPDFWQIFHCQGGHSTPLPRTGYTIAHYFGCRMDKVLWKYKLNHHQCFKKRGKIQPFSFIRTH